jgi:NAD(P)H-flavin reductase/ferredoxin
MGKIPQVLVNGDAFSARCGDLLLDAALRNGVDIPHDCRSGYCGTCRVRVVEGWVFGGETSDPGTVRACQCRVISDVKIAVEDVPELVTLTGRVARLVPLASDIVEVSIELPQPAHYFPGQYYKVQFRGFPSRCYSPTVPLDRPHDPRVIRLHVRRVPLGRVSSALGRRIDVGHRVKLFGPLGSAYLRSYRSRRLVLVASGTGFAPLWAIADAAMKEDPGRELVFVAGARKIDALYMIPALCRLATCRNASIIPVVSEPQTVSRVVRIGHPTDHLPALSPRDVVYAAGAPAMVERMTRIAKAAGATCHADPFESESKADDERGLLSRVANWLAGDGQRLPTAKAPRLQRSNRRKIARPSPGNGRSATAPLGRAHARETPVW